MEANALALRSRLDESGWMRLQAVSIESLVKAIPDAVVVWSCVRDDAGRIIDFRYEYLNAAAEVIIGMPLEGLIGQRLLEMLPVHRELGLFDRYCQVADLQQPIIIDIPWFEEGHVAGAFEASVAPLGDGILAIARDVTDRMLLERRLRTILDTAHDAIMVIGSDGAERFTNAAMTRMFGYDPEALTGTAAFDRVHPDDRRIVLRAWRSAGAGSTDMSFQARLLHIDGHYVPTEVTITDRRHDRAVDGVIATFRDLTTEQQAERELGASEARHRSLMAVVPDAVLVIEGRTIEFANDAAVVLLGAADADELAGRGTQEFWSPAEFEAAVEHCERLVADGDTHQTFASWMRRLDGSPVLVEAMPAVVPGRDRALLLVLRDITERQHLQEELAASEAMSRFLADHATEMLVRADSTLRIVYTTPFSSSLLELSPDDLLGVSLSDLFEPADRTEIASAVAEAVAYGVATPREVRARAAAAEATVWVEVTIRAVIGAYTDSHVVEYHVTLADVRERRANRLALLTSERRMRTLVDSAPIGIFEMGVNGRMIYVNPQLYVIVAVASAEQALTRSWEALVHPDDVSLVVDAWARSEDSATPFHEEFRLMAADGRTVWVDTEVVPVLDAEFQIQSFLGTVEDITDRKRADETVARLAFTDPLTGLSNRRHFLQHLQSAPARHVEGGRQHAVVFIDLDRFKLVNDALGHHEGDRLLEEVAAAIARATRPGDLIARLGGDEFAIVVEQITAWDVSEIAQRLCNVLSFHRALPNGGSLVVTGSIGCAIADRVGEDRGDSDAEGLLRRADAAMYTAKQLGRNRWVLDDRTT